MNTSKNIKITAGIMTAIFITVLMVMIFHGCDAVFRSCDVQESPMEEFKRERYGNKTGAWIAAEKFVKAGLRTPSTADFGWQTADGCVGDLGKGSYYVQGWVDAQNLSGAKVRNWFALKVRYRYSPLTNDGQWLLSAGPVFSAVNQDEARLVLSAMILKQSPPPPPSPLPVSSAAGKAYGDRTQPRQIEKKKKPELMLVQKRYLAMATALVFAKQEGVILDLDVRHDGKSSFGCLKGNFRINQIIGPGTFIADQVDRNDIPIYSVWIEGISTADQVDGKRVSFHDYTIFLHKGTKTYRTILGTSRTIYHITTVDKSLLQWAMAKVEKRVSERKRRRERLEAEQKQQRNAERQKRIGIAQVKLDTIEAELKQFESDTSRIAEYIELKSKIMMYEPHADNERIAPLLKKAKEQIKALGKVSETEIKQYKNKRTALIKRKQEAQKDLDACK